MYKATINEREYDLQLNPEGNSGSIDGESFNLDILESKNGSFHIIQEDKTFKVNVLSVDRKQKTMDIEVNGKTVSVTIQDQYDALLKSLGMEQGGAAKIKEIKAPMPGLVLDLQVKEGDNVLEKDPLLILEAMKMENIIKSPAEGVVKKVHAIAGNTVEKNEVLLEFE